MDLASQLVIGVATTFVLGLTVGPLLGAIRQFSTVGAPAGIIEEKWNALTNDTSLRKGACWLGNLERLLFFAAIWMDAYSIIAAWLAFKVASKWQVWAVIVSVPKTLEGVNEFDFLVARHKWASQRLVTFLLGTNANILIAFTGVGIGKFANHLCSLLG